MVSHSLEFERESTKKKKKALVRTNRRDFGSWIIYILFFLFFLFYSNTVYSNQKMNPECLELNNSCKILFLFPPIPPPWTYNNKKRVQKKNG